MPRSARLDAPGVLHHVIGRGIEKGPIFLSEEDRNDFLSRLGLLSEEGCLEVYAWALLGNCYHRSRMDPGNTLEWTHLG